MTGEGTQLREVAGRRSSQAVGRQVFAEAARAADAELAREIETSSDWRKRYLGPVRRLVEAGTRSADAAVAIAQAGLTELHRTVEFSREGTASPLDKALARPSGAPLETADLDGSGAGIRDLEVPYRGDVLRGDALRRQLDRWVADGVIEPTARAAVHRVMSEPDWLDLSDRTFILLGAGSEMGPLPALSRWGGHVVAVDIPESRLWDRILSVARRGRGRLSVPARKPFVGEAELPSVAGANLLSETPEILAWLRSFDGPLTIADMTYADGTTFLLLAASADALISELTSRPEDVSLAYLATPTDVYAVPEETVEGARDARRGLSPIRSTARAASIGRLYRPNYRETIRDGDGRSWGISDCLVPQQGPNYARAKNVQRWRATVERDRGRLVSANVAPPTRTRSVMKNPLLAAAYGGAAAFGVEAFEPATSRWLMAGLLVHDLRNPKAGSNPSAPLAHPFDLLADAAAHGGIWRLPYEARSVLPLAVARGFPGRRRAAPAQPEGM